MSLRTKRKKHETTECVTKLEREWGELHSMEDRCVDKQTQHATSCNLQLANESLAVCMHKHAVQIACVITRTHTAPSKRGQFC
jgi:hypothetical protein